MFVHHICFPVTTLGPGKRLGIWVSGCSKACVGCMSEELKDREESDRISLESLQRMIAGYAGRIEGVTISGGEPFDQVEELAMLVAFLSKYVSEDILLYTGYTFEELQGMSGAERVLKHVATLIDGAYVESLDDGEGLRGSRNQKVVRIDGRCDFDYLHAMRAQQLFVFGDSVLAVGLRRRGE